MSSDGFQLNLDRFLDRSASEVQPERESSPFEDELQYTPPLRMPPPPPPVTAKSAPPTIPVSASQDDRVVGSENRRCVIAIDYGTTYTGLAVIMTKSESAVLADIKVLQDWTPTMSNTAKVRTMFSYGKTGAQWGTDVTDDRITIVNTKLDLEPRENRVDELESTLHLLNDAGNLSFAHIRKIGPEPAFTTKSPTEIVTDYLTKIRECACALKADKKSRHIDLGLLSTTNTPVDIVITVPVNWSYSAKNATFQAFRNAGFNKTTFPTLEDTILISEPEAASYFTARDVQADFLEVDQCFILCDAGGGTVDVVSYQVTQSAGNLKIQKATAPESGRCGSVFIDTAFKQWLLSIIGPDHYSRLDPNNARKKIYPYASESGKMRELIKRFEEKKKSFSTSTEFVKIDLPEPLHKLTIEGRVNEGELTITKQEMQGFFSRCVDRVIELIQSQIYKVRDVQHRRVKNVFLVGGFGSSPYLREKLEASLKLRKNIKLRRPGGYNSWTAVVRGAAIYGVEKFRHMDIEYMSAVTRSYGIMVNQRSDSRWRFEWLIRNGDLVLRHEKRVETSRMLWLAPEQYRPTGRYDLVIYAYKGGGDEDDVPEWWQDGQHEVEEVRRISCDLTSIRRGAHRQVAPYPQDSVRMSPQMGPLVCRMELAGMTLKIEVLMNDTVVGRSEIQVKVDTPFKTSVGIMDDEDDSM